MKLTKSQIDWFSFEIAKGLAKKDIVMVDDIDKFAEKIKNIITEDLLIEDKLNEEVREILRGYTDEMRRSSIEYHEMFKKVKAKLVKDRKLIL
jgi:hypothetical protein